MADAAAKKAARELERLEKQCVALMANGKQCKNQKVEGSDMCRMHMQKAAAAPAKEKAPAAPKAAAAPAVAEKAGAVPAAKAAPSAVSKDIVEAGVRASGTTAARSKTQEVQDWLCSGASEFPRWPRAPPSAEAPFMKTLAGMSEEEYEQLPFPTGEQFQISKAAMKNVWNTFEVGNHYGMHFPHSIELIESMGAEWLTKAFHAAGSLPRDNSVAKLKRVIGLSTEPTLGEALGGAAIKVLLVLEYARPHPELHTEMFVKIPTAYTASGEGYKNRVSGMDEFEILFNRLVAPCVPVGMPKFYFGDYCRKNGNSIMIWEKLSFAKEWRPFAEYRPFELHPMMDKNKDWQVTEHGRHNYPALGRAMARLHAAYATEKLGPKQWLGRIFPGLDAGTYGQLMKGWPPPEIKSGDPGTLQWLEGRSAQTAGQVQSMVLMGCDFVLNVCPQLFPEELRDRAFLKQFVHEATHVGQYQQEYEMYLCSDVNYWALAHGNIQIDNAFYYNNEEGKVEAGLLDFGGLSHSNPVNALVRNWIGAEPEVMDEIDELILDSYIEELALQGGPNVDRSTVFHIARLTQANFAFSMAANLVMLYGTHSKRDPVWKTFTGRWDPKIENVFLTRAFTSNWRNMLLLWRSKKRAPYQAFLKWVEENPWLPKKPPVPEPPPGSI